MPAVIAYATCSWTLADWTATQVIELVDQYYLLVTSNETVHQNGNAEQIAPVAVSGATAC